MELCGYREDRWPSATNKLVSTSLKEGLFAKYSQTVFSLALYGFIRLRSKHLSV